jgi:hypothetical protein
LVIRSPRTGKSAAADLSNSTVVAVERSDRIRQRSLVIGVAGETKTVPHDLVADQ